jgi:iron complex outermembrane receptor protein
MPGTYLRILLLGSTAIASAASAQTPLADEQAVPATSATSAAAAAPAAQESAVTGIQDIVVTARRQEENLQRTPIAVTAISTETIRNAQIVDSVSVQRTAPSLSVQTGAPGNSAFTYISIRGAGTLNPGVANDPAVAIYVDGVYIPRPSQGVTELNDVARVEVLRGPQGTLFGRNTTGGAINVLSADPTGEFSGQVRAQYGNYDYKNIGGILNVPVMGEELAARFVYDFTDREGFGRNVKLNRDSNDRRSHFARAKLRWAPDGSDWSAVLSADYNKISDHGQFVSLAAFTRAANPLIGLAGNLEQYLHTKNNFYINYGQPRFNNPYTGNRGEYVGRDRFATGNLPYDFLEAYGGSLTIEGKLGELDLKSITAYRYSNSIGLNDLDGTAVQILASESFYLSDQYSQELQLPATSRTGSASSSAAIIPPKRAWKGHSPRHSAFSRRRLLRRTTAIRSTWLT